MSRVVNCFVNSAERFFLFTRAGHTGAAVNSLKIGFYNYLILCYYRQKEPFF